MAAKSLTLGENETAYDVKFNVIDGLHDLRALAAAGHAMADDTLDEDVHNMGRVLRQIFEKAGVLVDRLDCLVLS